MNPDHPGTLSIDPLLFSDSAALGSTAQHQVKVAVTGGDPADQLPFTVRVIGNSAWIKITTTTGAAPDTFVAALDPAGLALGSYKDTLEFSISGTSSAPIRLPVEFTIESCSITDVIMNASVPDTLTTADCAAPNRPDHFASLYRFTGSANDSVSVRLTSASGFDPYLVLDSAAGKPPISENDNCTGGGVVNPCLTYVRLPVSGSYLIEATTSAPGATGAFVLQVTRPRAPPAPDTLSQVQTDLVTPVPVGGAVDAGSIVLRGYPSDPDNDATRLEVEVRALGTAFTNVATAVSTPVTANNQATVTVNGLSDDVSYHWQARSLDATGRAGPWRSFGGNAESAADFRINIPQAPAGPASPAQLKSDATTAIAVGGTTNEPTVLFQATLSDPDPSDQLRLEVEVRPVGTAFTNVASGSSPQVAVGAVATANISGLSDNVTYHWQSRTVDQTGRTSAWTSFGGNAESATDFRVAVQPSRLTVIVQPSNTAAGGTISPAVQVAAQDAAGNTLASFAGQIAVAIGTNPSGGVLSGNVTSTASAGVATFNNLVIDKSGAGYTLSFTAGGLTVASSAFNILAGSATHLAFVVQPSNGSAGVALAPAVTVAALDGNNNVVTGFAGQVTIGLGSGPSGAALGGTTAVNAVSGVATFANLSLDRAGIGYTLTAGATGLAGATSATFVISAGAARRLAIATQPATTAASGAALSPQPVIQVQDLSGNAISQAGIVVTATIASGPGGAGLINASATSDASGQATFSGLAISGSVGGYVLSFGANGLTSVNANATQLSAGAAFKLAIVTQPSSSAASGAAFAQQPTVQVQDSVGNAVAQQGVVVTAAIASGTGTLGGTATATTSSTGLATFTNLSISGSTGARTLSFTATNLAAATSGTISIGSGAATTIALQAGNNQSATTGAPVAIAPAVLVTDGSGNPVANVAVTFAVTGGGGSVLTPGSAPVLTNGSGIAAVTSWTLGPLAGANTLTATASGLTGSPVTFTATATVGAAAHITISSGNNLTGPVGTQLSPHEVLVTDANSNPVGGVVVSWAAVGGGSVNPTQSTTDGTGHATTMRTLGPAAGTTNQTTTATATLGGTPTTVTFAMTATVGGASTLTLDGGDAQTDTVGQTLPTPLSVKVTDGVNPVAGVTINWQVTGGGGAITPTSQTNAQGIATAQWTLGTATAAGAATQSARADGVGPVAVNFIATAVPAPVSASHSVVSATPGTILASSGANTSTITVTARDQFDNAVPNKTVVLAASGAATGFTLVQPVGNTGSTGVAAGTLSGTLVATRTISATVDGVSISQTATVVIDPAAANRLAFLAQPSNTVAGAAISPAVEVEVQDQFNNRATGSSAGVTVALGNNPSGGTLSGTLTVNAAAGVASFANLRVNNAGAGYTLNASSGGLTGVPSNAFDVSVGAASTVTSLVGVSAGSVASGSAIQLSLQARDALGNNLTSGGLTIVFTAAGGSSTGTFGPVTDNGNGTYSGSFTGVAAGTATTIGATIGGNAVASSQQVTVTTGTPSAATSLVGVSANTVTSGASIVVTLQARDAAGNPVTGLANVAFTQGGGTSTGTFGTVTEISGTYSTTFTGVTAGSAINIGATIGGNAVTSVQPVTVTVGAASNATSVVHVSAGAVVAGSAITVSVDLRDAANNLVTGLTNVLFTQAGASTGTFGTVSETTPGTYGTTFTGVTAGTAATIGATVGGTPLTSTQQVTVTAGAASTTASLVNVSANTVVSGSAITVTLLARDANNNPVGGLANVAFTRTGGTSTGTFGAISETTPGTYSATFTGITAGSATTLGATIGGNAVSDVELVTVTVGPASTATSLVNVSASTVLSGSAITVTLLARDANNNPVTGLANVAFTQGGGTSTGAFGAVTEISAGTYQASFTGATAGTPTTIGATIGGSAVTDNEQVTVTAATASPTTSQVNVSAASVASGSAITVTLLARDASNNPVGGLSNVAFTQAGGTSTGTFGPVSETSTGTYQATFTGLAAGSATTIGATIGGNAVTDVELVTVVAGPASVATSQVNVSAPTVASGSAITVTLLARDANNNPVGGLTNVAFTQAIGTSTGTFGTVTETTAGTYQASFTGVTAGTATTIGATIGGNAVTDVEQVTVVAGPASVATSQVNVSANTVASSSAITVTLLARDANNNPVGGLTTVAFTQTGGTSTGTFGAVTEPVAGTYQASFTGVTAGSATTIGATIGASAVTDVELVTVTAGPTATVTLIGDGQTATVGAAVATPPGVELRDAHNNPVPGASVTFAVTAGGGVVDPTTVIVTGSNGIAQVTSWTMGHTPVTNTLSATTPLGTSSFTASATVGAPNNVVKIGDGQSAVIGTAVTTAPALQVRDQFNNPVPNVSVTFAVAAGGGVVDPTTAVLTGSNGIASSTSWTLGPNAGAGNNTLTATTVLGATSFTASGLQATQTITFAPPASPATFGTSFIVTPTASSGLPVTVTVAFNGCSILGDTVTMISGTLSCQLTASQTGNANYLAAPDVIHVVTAAKAAQATITLTMPGTDSIDAAGLVAVAAGGSSSEAFSYTSLTQTVCVVDGTTGVIAALAPGTCTLTASRNSDVNYLAATSAPSSFTVTHGNAANVAVNTGNAQHATVGTSVAVAPSVLVTDRNGNPVSGESVVFSPQNGTSVTGSPATTNASGIATVGSWTMDNNSGAKTLMVSVTGATNILFTATADPDVPAALVRVQGDGQIAGVGQQVIGVIDVLVTDTYGNPTPNVSVDFTATAGGGNVTGSPVTSDANGLARLPSGSWRLGTVSGINNNVLTASVGSITTLFQASATPGQLHHFKVEAAGGGDIPNQIAGATFNIRVTAQDIFDNTATTFDAPVDGRVNITSNGVIQGGGVTPPFNLGVLPSLTVSIRNTGDFAITATNVAGSETGTSNTFTVDAGPIAAINFVIQPTDQTSGTDFSPSVIVRAVDALGNVKGNYNGPVTITIGNDAGGGSTLNGTTTRTTVVGLAVFPGLSLTGAVANGYTLRASVELGSIVVDSDPFNIIP